MRYKLGEKLLVLGFYHNSPLKAPSVWSTLGSVVAQPELGWQIKIIELTVTEHHKVAWDQDPDGEKKYDGFILTDSKGMVYYNQYPHASYGQTTDLADRVFKVRLEAFSEEDLQLYFKEYQVVRYTRIDEFYEPMKNWEKNGFDPTRSEQVKAMVRDIDAELLTQYNAYLVAEPIWEKYPDIVRYVVKYHDTTILEMQRYRRGDCYARHIYLVRKKGKRAVQVEINHFPGAKDYNPEELARVGAAEAWRRGVKTIVVKPDLMSGHIANFYNLAEAHDIYNQKSSIYKNGNSAWYRVGDSVYENDPEGYAESINPFSGKRPGIIRKHIFG